MLYLIQVVERVNGMHLKKYHAPESPPATHPPLSPLAPSQTPSRETTPHDNLDESVSPLPPPLPPLTLYMDTSNNKVKLYCVHLDSIQL